MLLKHLWNKNFAYIPCISLRTHLCWLSLEGNSVICILFLDFGRFAIRLQASVGENQNASAAGRPSKPEDYHRVNTLFTSLGKVQAEIEDRFSWNDQVVIRDYYNFDK